jgi:hypothetical protein
VKFTTRLPLTAPVAVGEKETLTTHVAPAGIEVEQVLVSENPAVALIAVTETG